MSLHSKKLRYRRGGVDYAINLYTTAAEVGSNYAQVRADGVDLYAKLGPTSDPMASHLRVRKGGIDYAYLFEALDDLPSGFIGMFTASCPDGWTRETEFDDKFIRGASSYGGTGGVTSHNHTYDIPSTVSSQYANLTNYWWKDGSPEIGHFIWEHTHSYPGVNVTTSSKDNQPPYIKIVFCRKT